MAKWINDQAIIERMESNVNEYKSFPAPKPARGYALIKTCITVVVLSVIGACVIVVLFARR